MINPSNIQFVPDSHEGEITIETIKNRDDPPPVMSFNDTINRAVRLGVITEDIAEKLVGLSVTFTASPSPEMTFMMSAVVESVQAGIEGVEKGEKNKAQAVDGNRARAELNRIRQALTGNTNKGSDLAVVATGVVRENEKMKALFNDELRPITEAFKEVHLEVMDFLQVACPGKAEMLTTSKLSVVFRQLKYELQRVTKAMIDKQGGDDGN